MTVSTLRIREIRPGEFSLVWPIFQSVVAGGDALVHTPETTFDEAQQFWTAPPTRAFVAERNGAASACETIGRPWFGR